MAVATGREAVRIDVLGPIRARDADGRDVTPDGSLQRRLLALLVLRRGHVVSAAAAVEALWPSRLPADPFAALQNHVYRLRRGLPDGVVESVGDGYRLDPRHVEIDADRLATLLARDAGDDASLADLDGLLARWQGPAYPELGDVGDGLGESLRLDELRLRAREWRAERLLARGEADRVVAELAVLAGEHPLRERPHALLIAALAATGRRVEALRAYDDFRRRLGDELGVDPSPALAAHHAELLAGTDAGGAPWRPATRLPQPATGIVGRDALLAQVADLAERSRLVTLVGPGGVGKTRLLVELGRRLRAMQPDVPAVWCELASATTETTADIVAAALGIDARPGMPFTERLADVLRDVAVLLLLDNCEHVIEPAARLVERLLAACPGVRMVATSRERLRAHGEVVRTVPTLLGDDDGDAARQLFVERGRAVEAGFDPGGDELAIVAEIVRRLDGLPLAIELAAARLHTHDLGEIAAGLDRRFTLLSSGYRASGRHASLGAAVSWSYDQLDGSRQQLFAELSAFTGSFTLADAAAVAALEEAAAGDALAQLVERSLVLRRPDRRYALLETLRAFGAEQLAASGRADIVAERHARHQVDWIEEADRGWFDSGRPLLGDIDAALPELRVALGWLLEHGDVDSAGRLVAALLDYGILRLRPDVLAWAERVAAADPDGRSSVAPLVWVNASYAAWMAGDLVATGHRVERAARIAQRRGGELPAEVATMRGSHALFEGRLVDAASWYRRAAGLAAAAGDPVQQLMAAASELLALGYAGEASVCGLASALVAEHDGDVTAYAAYAWYCAGEGVLPFDVELARMRYARALELAEQTHATFVTGIAGASQASLDARDGDADVAAAEYRWLLGHWRRAGMWSTQWTMLRSIAALLERLGRPGDAAVLEGAVRATHAGHRIFGADEVALDELSARLRAALGDAAYAAARRQGAALDGDAAVEHALAAL